MKFNPTWDGGRDGARPIWQVIHSLASFIPGPSVAHLLPSHHAAAAEVVQVPPLLEAAAAAIAAPEAVLRPLDEDVLVLQLLVLVQEGVVVVQLGPPAEQK